MLAPTITRRDCAGLLASVALAALGCERPKVGKPPPGPKLAAPADAVPPDLDLTVRVAVARLRESLGPEAFGELEEHARVNSLSDPLATRALGQAQVAWVAMRLGLPPEQTDNVLVLSGDFRDLEPDSSRWSIATDLGAGWRYHDQKQAVGRALPSRLYAFTHEIWVFVSEAEIDAVDRLLGGGVRSTRLEVPERGLLSMAASMPALAHAVRDTSPKAARLLEVGDVMTAFADLGQDGVEAFFSFDFADERTAQRAAAATELLRTALDSGEGVTGMIAHSARVNTVSATVSLELSLSREQLGSLLSCGGGPCATDG